MLFPLPDEKVFRWILILALPKHFWDVKNKYGIDPILKWEIVKKKLMIIWQGNNFAFSIFEGKLAISMYPIP